MSFKKILCPTDFSEGSREALRLAIQLSKEHASELVLVHAWEPPYLFGPELAAMPDLIESLRRDAEEGLAKWKLEAEQLGERSVSVMLLMGSPWVMITEAAKQDRAIDLIVIGTHGRTGLGRFLIGSVAEKIVRRAPCSVLVARRVT